MNDNNRLTLFEFDLKEVAFVAVLLSEIDFFFSFLLFAVVCISL